MRTDGDFKQDKNSTVHFGNCTAEGEGALAAVTCGEAAVPHWLWGKRGVSSIKGMEFLSCGPLRKSRGVLVFDGQSLEATGVLGAKGSLPVLLPAASLGSTQAADRPLEAALCRLR